MNKENHPKKLRIVSKLRCACHVTWGCSSVNRAPYSLRDFGYPVKLSVLSVSRQAIVVSSIRFEKKKRRLFALHLRQDNVFRSHRSSHQKKMMKFEVLHEKTRRCIRSQHFFRWNPLRRDSCLLFFCAKSQCFVFLVKLS